MKAIRRNLSKLRWCSFCGYEQAERLYLIAGPDCFICNECVEAAREIGQQMVIDRAVREVANG